MTQSIACNAQNDIYLVNGILQFVTGEDAVDQNCRSVMKVRLGECILDLTRGLPFFPAIWNSYLPAQFTLAARQMLAAIDDVETVQAFTITQNKRFAIYKATIATTFGISTITGEAQQ